MTEREYIKRIITARIYRIGPYEPLPERFSKRLITKLHENDIGSMRSLLNVLLNHGARFYLRGIGNVMKKEILLWARDEGLLTAQERYSYNVDDLFIDRFSKRLRNALWNAGIRSEEQVKALMLKPKDAIIKLVRNLGKYSYMELYTYAQDNDWPIFTSDDEERLKATQLCDIVSLVGTAICDMYDNNTQSCYLVKDALTNDELYRYVPKHVKKCFLTCLRSIEEHLHNKSHINCV